MTLPNKFFDKSPEFKMGWSAFEQFLSDASNPYPDDSPQWNEWGRGRVMAQLKMLEDNFPFYRTLNFIGAFAEYLDVKGFEERYAAAKTDSDPFDVEVDLNGRLATTIKQLSFLLHCSGGVPSDAAIPFQGVWPYKYVNEVEKLVRERR
jgi:hypothetical protein